MEDPMDTLVLDTIERPAPSTTMADADVNQTTRVAAVEDNMAASPDISDTLEYLRAWTLRQDRITQQTVEHQKLVEAMMQTLLQKNGNGNAWRQPVLQPLESLSEQVPTPKLATTRLASPRTLRSAESIVDPDEAQVSEQHLKDDGVTRPSQTEEDESRNSLPGQVKSLPRGCSTWSDESLGRLHPIFVDAIWYAPPQHVHDQRTWHLKTLEAIVESPRFEYFAACFIVLHSIFIGISVEYVASASNEKHVLLTFGNILFVSVFCAEVGLKVIAERQEFIHGHEWKWNIFDLLLILTVLIEVIMGGVLSGKNAQQKKSMKTMLKIAEMVRTVRILRIFRMLKFSLTLRVVVAKVLSSAGSLGWILILFALMVYVVSVCLTQGCNDFLDGQQHLVGSDNLIGTEKEMNRYFGSIATSSFTLFASIAGGLVWSDVYDVLAEVSFFYASMFVMFQALSFIAVMNLITGIFVGNAINSDVDLVMEAEAKESQTQAAYLKTMFDRMDANNSGSITLDEFMKFARNPDLEFYLKPLNINPNEAETLFHLLDEDNSGSIQVDEFLSACVDLRGATRSIDMKVLLYDNKRMRRKMFKHVQEMENFAVWAKDMLGTMSTAPQASNSETTSSPCINFKQDP